MKERKKVLIRNSFTPVDLQHKLYNYKSMV